MDAPRKEIDYIGWILNGQIILFFIKMIIVMLTVTLSLLMWWGIISNSFSKKRDNDSAHIAKIYLKGMIQNPEAFIIAAEINIERSRYSDAVKDIRLAIALAELNHMDAATIVRYKKMLLKVNRMENLE